MDIDKIGEFIKQLRLEKKLSQNQLSEEIHVTRQAVSNWENGKTLPDSNILLLLSDFFNVSINEILSGKRKTDSNDFEEIALKLVDDNNRKMKKIKKIIVTFSSIIAVLLLIFLSYYFINNYNSIKVYKIKGKGKIFETRSGLFITTKHKSYLRLGSIVEFENKNNYKINMVHLYYLDKNNNKIYIYKRCSSKVLVKDSAGYSEFNLNKNRKYLIKNLYLKIEYQDNKSEIIKLKLTEDFRNNFNILNKKHSITITKENENRNDEKTLKYETKQLKEETLLDNLEARLDEEDSNSQEHNNKDTDKNINTNQSRSEIEVSNMTENNTKEQTINTNVQLEETSIEEIQNDEEKEEVDYDELITLIQQYGRYEYGSYIYEFTENDKAYMAVIQEYTINIAVMNNDNIKSWVKSNNRNGISFQKFYNNQEVKNIFINYENMSEEEQIIYNDYLENTIDILSFLKSKQ